MSPALPPDDRAVIILAGGKGVRLGGELPKALRMLAGRSLLDRAVERARAWSDEVWVSVPPSLELPEGSYRMVRDHSAFGPWAGPMVALASSLAAVTRKWALVLAVDLPFARPEVLDLLWSHRDETAPATPLSPAGKSALGVIPWLDHGPEPLLALYRRDIGSVLLASAQSGERSIVRAVSCLPLVRLSDRQLREVDPQLTSFRNLNTREDWDLAERSIASAQS